jgi:hypothetical protein
MPPDRLFPFSAVPSVTVVAGAVQCGTRVFLSARSALRQDGSA